MKRVQAKNSPDHYRKNGRLRALIRWDVVIDGIRIFYKRLSADFILYHVERGTAKLYINPSDEELSRPGKDEKFRS
jgi:hypothetical protein